MTDTATEPFPAATNDTWAEQIAQLKTRYKHVREPVLAALNMLLQDQNIALDDAKAQAQLHGVRITAASVNAARTLMARIDSPAATAADPESREPSRTARRTRAVDKPSDAEALVRAFVAKLQGQGSAEADRLREAIRKAVGVLQAALGS